MRTTIFFLLLFFCCACEKEDLVVKPDDGTAQMLVNNFSMNVSVSISDNDLIISCSAGAGISLLKVYVTGDAGFSASAGFQGSKARVRIPGFGYYSIEVQYFDVSTQTQKTEVLTYDYRAQGGQVVPPDAVKCQHDFSNFNKYLTWERNMKDITFTVCYSGSFKAVLYPIYIEPGYSKDDVTYAHDLNWGSAPIYETLRFNVSLHAGYELRIYLSDCKLAKQDKCTHYLRFRLDKMATHGTEPAWLD